MEIKVGEPAPENDGPPARFLVPGSGPSTILTHGRGSNLDVPAIVGFNQGFGRTHSSLAFARGKENEAERAAVFNALAANYPTNTFTGRSFGARAATIAALKNPAINQLICFTIPIVRERDTSLSEDLLKLPATTDVLFVLGNDDARTPEIELHRVRKLMKARTWWIRVILGDHGLFYLPESKRVALAKVMGQLAAQWCENRDPAKTEFVLDWVEDKEKGLNQPVWSEWQPIQEDPAEGWGCAVQ
ncbi:uncharacterized protein LY89DRAFT_573255 [Mollisia scopiformis]|uniref:Uncharacterized protein n=1 Tax=Mollisia scopiformis TaxID=149040 RepID=A0A194XVD6_MOLSC|nr:uncharacterized protein LY89DRAFT_573255 [Mollisia scopiformis]KUJ23974.1 hypothetical protein LY89DRAFT_573255 [Mollisia scopiformis]